MKTLIAIFILSLGSTQLWAFERAELWQERLDRSYLEGISSADVPLTPEEQEWAEKRDQAKRVYSLIQDEVKHILPEFVGALDGQGAGARLSEEELQTICEEVQHKLSYHRSCLHAAKVAAGLSKEEVLALQKRRKKHAEYYTARINSIEKERVAMRAGAKSTSNSL